MDLMTKKFVRKLVSEKKRLIVGKTETKDHRQTLEKFKRRINKMWE